jgi:hypothetical protein
MYTDARKALSKAKIFLASLKDEQARKRQAARQAARRRHNGSNARGAGDVREIGLIDKLAIEYSILEHAVGNLKVALKYIH